MFSLQELRNRLAVAVTQHPDPDHGSILVEYAFLFIAVVGAALIAGSAMGSSIIDLWSSNTERFATAIQPALER